MIDLLRLWFDSLY